MSPAVTVPAHGPCPCALRCFQLPSPVVQQVGILWRVFYCSPSLAQMARHSGHVYKCSPPLSPDEVALRCLNWLITFAVAALELTTATLSSHSPLAAALAWALLLLLQ